MADRFQQLKDYFAEKDLKKTPRKSTGVGLFSPTDLGHLNKIIDMFIKRGIIDISRPISDSGGGDGRAAALFAQYFERVVCTEYDEGLVEEARTDFRTLGNMQVIDESRITLIQGDFSLPETYRGLLFSDIATFYNFKNGEHKLLIIRDSPKGVVSLLYDYRMRQNLKDYLFWFQIILDLR